MKKRIGFTLAAIVAGFVAGYLLRMLFDWLRGH